MAAVVQRAKAAQLQGSVDERTDAELEALLFTEKQTPVSAHLMPDFEQLSKGLSHKGVTLKRLWMEYCEWCRQAGKQPFMYSQFCYHFQQYTEKTRATLHIPRKPGDQDNGELVPVYLFVGVLPYSQYAYTESLCQNGSTKLD